MEKQTKQHVLCVISHTHWDREWYMPLEQMRLRLVDLIDRCLALLEREPTYIFHLDAQTVVLEDYLAIRCDRRERSARMIADGRLSVGPWYLQNDFYLTSGEATVRNLLEGTRLAESFGGGGYSGYAPDQFGTISQLPQILHGFGIDDFFFGRGGSRLVEQPDGTRRSEMLPCEFVWEGADGSRVLAIHMTHWYNNAQRFSADIDKAQRMTEQIEQSFVGTTATPYLLLMNGVDHLEAQEDLLPILQSLRGRGIDIRQMRMDDYVRHVKADLHEHGTALPVWHGELRGGDDGMILKGTLSDRVYLKQGNDRLQDRLERQLEPLYMMLALAAGDEAYPADHFRYLWKELMKNHPHDSICGSSCDPVHDQMEDRFSRLFELTDDMARRGMALAAAHIVLPDATAADYGLLFANTTPYPRTETVRAVVDIPEAEAFAGFTLTDPAGRDVPFRVLGHEKAAHNVFSPINLPGFIPSDRYTVEFVAEALPPYSFRAYRLRRAETLPPVSPDVPAPVQTDAVLENAFLRVTVAPDGRVDILHKASGAVLRDALDLEETADIGDSYIYRYDGSGVLYGHDFPAEVTACGDKIAVRRTLTVPAAFDFAARRRSTQTVEIPVELTLRLPETDRHVTLSYRFDNRAQDHRLRLLFRTGVHAEVTTADIPFDVVTHGEKDHHPYTGSKVLPVTSFAVLEGAAYSAAVLTEGQHEYEQIGDALAFTLVRSTGVITRDGASLRGVGDEGWLCPGNQCLRTMEGRVGLYPYSGALTDSVPQEAALFRTPMPPFFFSADPKKFTGGRPAVQDTTITELFYMPDPFPALRLTSDRLLLRLHLDPGVVVTALKRADRRGGLILRLLDLDTAARSAALDTDALLWRTTLSEKEDEPLDDGALTLRPKQLLTVRLCRREQENA